MSRNVTIALKIAVLFILLTPLLSIAQSIKPDKDVTDCIIVMEINSKKYCISNASYSSSFNETPAIMEDAKVISPAKVEITYYLSITMNHLDVSQDLLDWALINPSKKQSGSLKIYNTTKSKLLKEIKFEEATLSSFSDTEDALQQTSYAATSLSINCKKLVVKLL